MSKPTDKLRAAEALPGQCDDCWGNAMPGLGRVCACLTGQGADLEDCRCGVPRGARVTLRYQAGPGEPVQRITLPRMRPRYVSRPRPAIEMADTPHPNCWGCHGKGGHEENYAGPDGEYEGTDFVDCFCWESSRHFTILLVPQWIARLVLRLRRRPAGYSAQPPF